VIEPHFITAESLTNLQHTVHGITAPRTDQHQPQLKIKQSLTEMTTFIAEKQTPTKCLFQLQLLTKQKPPDKINANVHTCTTVLWVWFNNQLDLKLLKRCSKNECQYVSLNLSI